MTTLTPCPFEGKPPKQLKNKRNVVRKRVAVITGAAPVKNDADAATVAVGRDAWQRRKTDTATWDDWKLIGQALVVGRRQALSIANKAQPSGKQYNQAFSFWLKQHGFDDIDSADRADLFKIMDTLEEIEEWRARLTEEQRAKWNYPGVVWRVSRCVDRGLPRLRSTEPVKPTSNGNGIDVTGNGSEATTPPNGQDDEHEEVVWQRGLLLRAKKSIGDAQLHDHWAFNAPPDPLLIAQVRMAADTWSETAVYLESIANASPEELANKREGYAQTKELRKALKEKKEAKGQARVQ